MFSTVLRAQPVHVATDTIVIWKLLNGTCIESKSNRGSVSCKYLCDAHQHCNKLEASFYTLHVHNVSRHKTVSYLYIYIYKMFYHTSLNKN